MKNYQNMQKNISYTGVILDNKSRSLLAKAFKSQLPSGWDWVCHHMTITLGALPNEAKNLIDQEVTLTVEKLGISDMAMAVAVSGFVTKNEIAHITLGVNTKEGGKPMMSNKITKWTPVEHFTVTGNIEEIEYQEKKSLDEAYDVKALPFYNDIGSIGGKIYQVGGAVRDTFLGKQSKDLDILITGVPASDLDAILKKYGKVDMVGASFGVIKFTPPGGEEIDIAIPRTEKKVGAGYKGFDVSADHTLPIEKDLERRDFTINSIAKDSEGNIIDPFNGQKDLDAKLIRLTNPQAFADDPLRMLRAVQFASRFDFKIDPGTFKLIQQNAQTISEISKERILIEFDKIVYKGNALVGAELLVQSGLYQGIFEIEFSGDYAHFGYVTRMSEFMYWLTECFTEQPDQYFKTIMKGDDRVTREISALSYLYKNLPGNDKIKQRWVYFQLNKLANSIFLSKFVKSLLKDVYPDFESKKYPASLNQLAINGNDLMSMGLSGKQVGDALMNIIGAIYSDQIRNDKEEIINWLQNQNKPINEEKMEKEKKVAFYDFDGTIMDSPHPGKGKDTYSRKVGKAYPYKGWWGRSDSLFHIDENGDMHDIYDIQPNADILKRYEADANDPHTYVVLLTNRIPHTEKAIKKALSKHGIKFDEYSYKKDHREKGDRIRDILKSKYPDVKKFEFYDDDRKHFQSVHDNFIDTDFDYTVYHIVDGKIQEESQD